MAGNAIDRGAAEGLIGQSTWMKGLRDDLERLASSDVSLLLQGESGTGKELVARTIHRLSRRSGGPFIGVNCAAIHESLLESELFGHTAGAYTGAGESTLGVLRAADGGTILLDEVGDMGPALQSKLLRVLEQREVVPVGGTEAIGIDLRVIAAANCDLAEAVADGRFRRDLYYRLNVVTLKLEPLRRRGRDIRALVEHFLKQIAEALGIPAKKVSPAAMSLLLCHDWPGNVRELGNVIQRAYVLGRGDTIEPRDLPECLLQARPVGESGFPTLRQAVRDHVKQALDLSGGRRAQTARLLGIDRKSLWRMIRRYGLAEC